MKIKETDIANGDGVRVSIFVSGCRHHCKNCFNSEAWDFNAGKVFDENRLNYLENCLKKEYIQGLTILGGEPLEPENQETVYKIIKHIKNKLPKKDIWIYTGFTFEELTNKKSKVNTKYTEKILKETDILVDGPFIESLHSIILKFKGSSNQRIIDLKKTLNCGYIIEK